MTNAELLDIANRGATVAWARLGKLFGKIGAMPIIEINNRLTVTAGRAWIEEGKIDLSASLMREFTAQFLAETIPHELCHHVAWRIFGDGGHGPDWKRVMRAYGIEPNRCHSYIEQRALKRKIQSWK